MTLPKLPFFSAPFTFPFPLGAYAGPDPRLEFGAGRHRRRRGCNSLAVTLVSHRQQGLAKNTPKTRIVRVLFVGFVHRRHRRGSKKQKGIKNNIENGRRGITKIVKNYHKNGRQKMREKLRKTLKNEASHRLAPCENELHIRLDRTPSAEYGIV